jgi:cation diffusion facilitator family transporter
VRRLRLVGRGDDIEPRLTRTDVEQRDRQVLRVIWIEGSVNLLVLALKLGVGLSTHSLAVLADAVHSLSDLANNVVAWLVLRSSTAPPDRDHPYGHRKFETLAVFVLAGLLTVLAFELIRHALAGAPRPAVQQGWGLAAMGGVLALNVALASWEARWARRLDSTLLRADATHTFADVTTTLVVIAGWQAAAHGWPWIDRLCAMGVGGLILFLAYGLFRRALPVLVDAAALDPEAVARAVGALPGVRSVTGVRSRSDGTGTAVDLVVRVDPNLSTEDSHAIADRVEDELRRRFGASDVAVHVEPELARRSP